MDIPLLITYLALLYFLSLVPDEGGVGPALQPAREELLQVEPVSLVSCDLPEGEEAGAELR